MSSRRRGFDNDKSNLEYIQCVTEDMKCQAVIDWSLNQLSDRSVFKLKSELLFIVQLISI